MTLTAEPYRNKNGKWHWIARGHGGKARIGCAQEFGTRGRCIADILDVSASVKRNGINIRLGNG